MKRMLFNNICLLSLIWSLVSCGNDPFYIDNKGVKAQINVQRFDQDFWSLKSFASEDSVFYAQLQTLKQQYPAFFDDWLQMPELMGLGPIQDPVTRETLKEILKSDAYAFLMKTIEAHFNDFDQILSELQNAYNRFVYYFPEHPIPTIIPFVSNFSMTMNPVGNGYIGMSLEMHLGDTFGLYKMLNPPIEQYFFKLFNQQNILPLHFMALGNELAQRNNKGQKFCDEMLYWGKLLYFIEAMMPDKPKHLIIGFSKEEMVFCNEEEKNIWEYFVKEDLLFSSNKKIVGRYFSEGPFTVAPNVPPDAPAMLGRYLGWQIMRAYMKKFPDSSLQDMMQIHDAEAFISKVKYNPS